MLETNLRCYLESRGVQGVRPKSTLGGLVKRLNENGLISENSFRHFRDLAFKRNYLAHSLHDLFSEAIPTTVLPREGLTETDVYLFIDKAEQLAEDLFAFAKIVSEADKRKHLL